MQKIFILLTFVLISCSMIGQEVSYSSELPIGKKKSSLPNKYRSVALKFGPRILDTDPGKIITKFADDSPATDRFESTFNVEDSYTSIGFQIAYEWRKYSGLNHSIFFDISSGKNASSGLFGYSLGWNIPVTESLIVRPGIGVMFGSASFDLGQIENKSGYIQVDSTRFFDSKLDVSLEGGLLMYSPELTFRYVPSEKVHILLNLNYDIGSQDNGPNLVFNTVSGASESLRATKPINTSNPDITYNGKKLSSMPYKVGGLRLSLGAAYVWSRD